MNHRMMIVPATLLVLAGAPASATVYVVDQAGGGNFTAIQDAINAAQTGDEIQVHPGTYVENIDFSGKDIWVHSTVGPGLTTIDGSQGPASNGSCVTFASGETEAAVLEGFRITGGVGTPDYLRGGGIRCVQTSPTIRACQVENNTADHGGGLYLDHASPLVESCEFRHNTAYRWGGAINGSGAPIITQCLFEYNTTGNDGGAIASGTMTGIIDRCTFRYNIADHAGGAIELSGVARPLIQDCVFKANKAETAHGGAVRLDEALTTIRRCVFQGNWAALDGGGLAVMGGGAAGLLNCTFYGNDAGRTGGNIAAIEATQVTMSNCIVTEAVSNGGVFVEGGSAVAFHCNDCWNNSGGDYLGIPNPTGMTGNISLDPQLCDPAGGDFHIDPGSPCAPDQQPICGLVGALEPGCGFSDVASGTVSEAALRVTTLPLAGTRELGLVQFTLPERGAREARLEIFDAVGRRVQRLFDGPCAPGLHTATWDGRDATGAPVASGVYYCRLVQGMEQATGHLLVVR